MTAKAPCLALALLTLLAGCAVHGKSKLYDGIDRPREPQAIEYTVRRYSFLDAGSECARLKDWPEWVHPVFVQIFGCAVVYFDNRCTVILGTDLAMVAEEEIRHCEGWER